MRDARVDLVHVDVVVTHYNDPKRLAWVLDALVAQTYPAYLMHIVVADDGSDPAPHMPPGVRLVSQPDEGFRAAAARNLGAREGRSPIVLFLDGDTVPESGYVAHMVAALADTDAGVGALAVGRRRHADLSAIDDIPTWLNGSHTTHVLPEPQWLRDGYERTNNLRAAGEGDWRFVISAVMGMTRMAFEQLRGFDASLVGYGGEDWDLAYRAWNTGVELIHVPEAIAWHDGPDAGGRPELTAVKQGEQLALAQRIPQPLVRGRGFVWPIPRIVIRWNAEGLSARARYVVLESWMTLGDVAIYGAPSDVSDSRLKQGEPDAETLMRAEFISDLTDGVILRDGEALLAAANDVPRETSGVRVARTRHLRQHVCPQKLPVNIVEPLPESDVDLESWGRTWWS